MADRVDDLLDHGRADRRPRRPGSARRQLDEVRARERAFVDLRRGARQRARGHRGCAARRRAPLRASLCAARSISNPRASARHCSVIRPTSCDSAFAGRVAFCAVASCCALGSPSTTTRLSRAHSRSSTGALRPGPDTALGDPGDLSHARALIDNPFRPDLGVQLVAHNSLVDDAGALWPRGTAIWSRSTPISPSARACRLGTRTWVCRCGSPHRDVSCW